MRFNRKALDNLALITQIGISMMTPIFLCILLGNFIDKKLNLSKPIFLMIFTVLGVATLFVSLFKLATGGKGIKRK